MVAAGSVVVLGCLSGWREIPVVQGVVHVAEVEAGCANVLRGECLGVPG